MSCCCCIEACPQFTESTGFAGAATISQVRLFNEHPTGKVLKRERLTAITGDGGIQECGYAQNCAKACPKLIPRRWLRSAAGESYVKRPCKPFGLGCDGTTEARSGHQPRLWGGKSWRV